MTNVEITVDNENYTTGGSERLVIAAHGSLAASLRSCILRVGDHFAHDAAVCGIPTSSEGIMEYDAEMLANVIAVDIHRSGLGRIEAMQALQLVITVLTGDAGLVNFCGHCQTGQRLVDAVAALPREDT